jgi:aminodeoxyfutalosine deaminase
MKKISADYIFPINKPPVKRGVLIIEDSGKIINVIDPVETDFGIGEVEHFNGILCPGFVNTHCHTELSYLRDKIEKHTGLNEFILELEKLKKLQTDESMIIEGIENAEKEMLSEGIVAVGDILNTEISYKAKKAGKLAYHSFIELFGSDETKADKIFADAEKLYRRFYELTNASIVPHSAYSVSEKLFNRISQFAHDNDSILTMHHQESEDENLFFLNKSGKIPERAKQMGIDISSFRATGLRPLDSVSRYLPSKNNIQLVHNTYTNREDIEFAMNRFSNVWWGLCPCANMYIEKRLPDIRLLIENNCNLTIGTDSCASNNKLSVLNAMKTISFQYPEIGLQELLKWATLNGAEFLQMNDRFGSFERGKTPGIILIENTDLTKPALLKGSKVKVLY